MNPRNLLSAAQVALSIVLLIGAALLMESIVKLRGVALGFNAENLLTVSVSLPISRYDTDRKIARFFENVDERLAGLPGVRGAAAAMSLPMMSYPGVPVQDASKPLRPLNQRLIAKYFPITPDYFRTLGIALRRGRAFTERDNKDAQRVAIIDESMARHFWPRYPAGPDPVGQHLWVGGINPKPAEIVGVVADVKQSVDSRGAWQEGVYVSFAQNPTTNAMLAIRTAGDPLSFVRVVGEQVRSVDQDQPIGTARTMEARVAEQAGEQRLVVGVLGSFALVALVLALIGIYGVIAYSVAQRVREIGIRQALGAQRGDILRLVIGQGVVLSLTGIVIGLSGAIALTRVLGALLFQVGATDPPTFIAIAALFFLIALLASYIPARRATTVDPISTLRV
jgi:predicted permease